jgi:hypothetical protein
VLKSAIPQRFFVLLDGPAARCHVVSGPPIHCGALTGCAADLTDIFVVGDTEQPRSQVRSHLPEVKIPERSRQTLLEEVVGVDRIMRRAARISSKIGKNALDVAMQYGLNGIDSF